MLLTIGVAAELAGPFIAKAMIDNHLLAIEKPYYQTTASEEAANYNGTLLQTRRPVRTGGNQRAGSPGIYRPAEASISSMKLGKRGRRDRSFADGTLTVIRGSRHVYPAMKQMSADDLLSFYKPEMPGIYQLIGPIRHVPGHLHHCGIRQNLLAAIVGQ